MFRRRLSPKVCAWLGATALLAIAPAAMAQTDTWSGASSSNWTDAGNWSLTAPPTSANTALFNANTPNMSISLGGAPQTVGAIQFDNTGALLTSSYTLGQGGGGSFVIATAGNATTGAISMTNSVNNGQTIADPISFSVAAPFITNFGTTNSSLTLGNITTPSGTVTTLVTGVSGAIGTSTNSTTNLGNVVLAATGVATGTVQSVMTLTTNGTTGLAIATSPPPPYASGTLIGQGVISGGIAGPGSTNFTTTIISVLLNGGGSQSGASNGGTAGVASILTPRSTSRT